MPEYEAGCREDAAEGTIMYVRARVGCRAIMMAGAVAAALAGCDEPSPPPVYGPRRAVEVNVAGAPWRAMLTGYAASRTLHLDFAGNAPPLDSRPEAVRKLLQEVDRTVPGFRPTAGLEFALDHGQDLTRDRYFSYQLSVGGIPVLHGKVRVLARDDGTLGWIAVPEYRRPPRDLAPSLTADEARQAAATALLGHAPPDPAELHFGPVALLLRADRDDTGAPYRLVWRVPVVHRIEAKDAIIFIDAKSGSVVGRDGWLQRSTPIRVQGAVRGPARFDVPTSPPEPSPMRYMDVFLDSGSDARHFQTDDQGAYDTGSLLLPFGGEYSLRAVTSGRFARVLDGRHTTTVQDDALLVASADLGTGGCPPTCDLTFGGGDTSSVDATNVYYHVNAVS